MSASNHSIVYTVNTTSYDTEMIKTKHCKTPLAEYEVLNYDKTKNENEQPSEYRSVVICPVSKEMVCFSPPKSIEMNEFMKKSPVLLSYDNNVVVNEFI